MVQEKNYVALESYRQRLKTASTLEWRHNESDGVSNQRRLYCLLNFWFRRRAKLCVSGFLCGDQSPHKRSVTRKMFPFDDVIMEIYCCVCLDYVCILAVSDTFHITGSHNYLNIKYPRLNKNTIFHRFLHMLSQKLNGIKISNEVGLKLYAMKI